MSKVTEFIKNEICNHLDSLEYAEAKKEILKANWNRKTVLGIEIGSATEGQLYQEVAYKLLDELLDKREFECERKGVFIKNNHTIEIMTKRKFYCEILGIDPINSTVYERFLAKNKAKDKGKFFVDYSRYRTYMLENFTAQELSDALAILLDNEEFESFANDMINECEQAFYSQCVDFALEKMSHKILDGTTLDFKYAVEGWVSDRLVRSGSFVSLEIPSFLTKSGKPESINFDPKTLLN